MRKNKKKLIGLISIVALLCFTFSLDSVAADKKSKRIAQKVSGKVANKPTKRIDMRVSKKAKKKTTKVEIKKESKAYSFKQYLNYKGMQRSYIVRNVIRKRNYKVPLLIVLHGGGGNALNVEKMTGFTKKAFDNNFIVVYPEGTGRIKDKFTWNAEHCCAYAMKSKVDDVGFIRSLINELRKTHPIDRNRVFVTGMSNGAMMTHKLGAEIPHKITAIAPVVGGLFGDEIQGNHSVSAIMINGARDKSVRVNGGEVKQNRAGDSTPLKPVKYQGEYWAKANNCDHVPLVIRNKEVVSREYYCGKDSDRRVISYMVSDNGHAWPGGKRGSVRGDLPSKQFNATDVIWNFFRMQYK